MNVIQNKFCFTIEDWLSIYSLYESLKTYE